MQSKVCIELLLRQIFACIAGVYGKVTQKALGGIAVCSIEVLKFEFPNKKPS